MADRDPGPRYLHLVTDATTPQAGERPATRPAQPELRLGREPSLLGLFVLTPARMRLFAKAIDVARPPYVFDLRVLPTFEGGGLSRRSLFPIMESSGCTYVDVMGLMGGGDRRHALLHSGALADCVRSICGTELVGPMFFLLQSGEDLTWSRSTLPRLLQPAPPGGWSVHVLAAGRSDDARPSMHDIEARSMESTVQPWSLGEVLYVVASPSESTGWLLDDGGRLGEPVNLRRGCSVRVVGLQIGQWTDVEVLGGQHRGRRVRLASNAHAARLVK